MRSSRRGALVRAASRLPPPTARHECVRHIGFPQMRSYLCPDAKEPGYFRCGVGDGMHRDVPLQFIDEGTASLLDPRCVGSRHAMDELREGHRRDSDINFAKGLRD